MIDVISDEMCFLVNLCIDKKTNYDTQVVLVDFKSDTEIVKNHPCDLVIDTISGECVIAYLKPHFPLMLIDPRVVKIQTLKEGKNETVKQKLNYYINCMETQLKMYLSVVDDDRNFKITTSKSVYNIIRTSFDTNILSIDNDLMEYDVIFRSDNGIEFGPVCVNPLNKLTEFPYTGKIRSIFKGVWVLLKKPIILESYNKNYIITNGVFSIDLEPLEGIDFVIKLIDFEMDWGNAIEHLGFKTIMVKR
ncbi:MAG: hypothetical protein WC942_01495 [Clostridia bacterium]|jgi:hypothetical protein